MSCIKFPSSKNELIKASNKENVNENNLTISQLTLIADQVFGQDNWSHAITNQTLDFIDYITGKYQAGCVSIVRVQLRDGTFHEGMGYCNIEGSSKGSAIQKARLISYNDAFKKALTCFGNEIALKIKKLSTCPSSPVSSESIPNVIHQTKSNVLTLSNIVTEAPTEVIAMSQTDAMMDMVDLDQLLNKDNKINDNNNTKKLKIDTSKPATCIEVVVSKDNDVHNIDFNKEINISKTSASIDAKIFNDKDKLNTVNALKKEIKTEVLKTAVSTAISDEEMRLERKRKQRELQEEFKRKQEIKKKHGDNESKLLPNPRY